MIQGSCSECIWCKGLLEAKKPDVVRICDGMVLTNREDMVVQVVTVDRDDNK